jgi:hypothetical protein
MTTILPTHKCFDDAIDLLGDILKAHPDAADTDEFQLVHAICSPGGDPFSHAWIESKGGIVFWYGIVEGDGRSLLITPAPEYRAQFKIIEEMRYTPRQAWEENKRTGHYGPWVEKYRQLTGRGDILRGEMQLRVAKLTLPNSK